MYRNLGWDQAACAKNLHITRRTLHNWESGRHDIPYTAYRLLRLLNRMELPGESWSGWCFHGGVLYSPEGRGFVGTDGSWWSLLVRRAAMFDHLFQLVQKGAAAAQAWTDGGVSDRAPHGPAGGDAAGPTAPAGGRREAPALDLSIRHISTITKKGGLEPHSAAIKFTPMNSASWKLIQGGGS
ncbi:VC1465 family Xer recombination activation factor [Acidovorax sp. BL-A-41-H1]|uniref:VC1465 family Xer recombination activation factor n=1 Tax=Acidovorax sp. BL-A-41-H1 TaxID=3421102 RepID=UPI003F79C394